MSDFSNKTRNELRRLEVDLKGAVDYFTKSAAKAEADLKEVTNALKAIADSAVTEAKVVAETVKEEVKKAAPKKSTKKADKKAEEAATETPAEAPAEAPVEEVKAEEAPAEDK